MLKGFSIYPSGIALHREKHNKTARFYQRALFNYLQNRRHVDAILTIIPTTGLAIEPACDCCVYVYQ